jgi:hypothetical protein
MLALPQAFGLRARGEPVSGRGAARVDARGGIGAALRVAGCARVLHGLLRALRFGAAPGVLPDKNVYWDDQLRC